MEKEIGCPLFIRTNKGVHFTDAGARLFSFAEKELQQYQDMKNYVTHEPNSISGVLRIGASQSFSQSHGPALLKGFVDEYSDIEISLTTDTSDRLVKLVKKEDIHLAIVRGNQEWPESDILLEDAPLYLISAKPKRLQYLRGNRQPRSWPLTDSGRHASQVQTECRPTDDLQQPEAAYISSEPPHIQRSHAPVYTRTDFC